jgi:hypothetical protein
MLPLASSVCGLFNWRQFEHLNGGDPACGRLAFALFAFPLGCGEVAGRAGPACRPRHCLKVGPTLCLRNSAPIATAAPTDQRQLVGWTRPTSGLMASGSVYTGLSTRPVRRSTSFCRLSAMLQRIRRLNRIAGPLNARSDKPPWRPIIAANTAAFLKTLSLSSPIPSSTT